MFGKNKNSSGAEGAATDPEISGKDAALKLLDEQIAKKQALLVDEESKLKALREVCEQKEAKVKELDAKIEKLKQLSVMPDLDETEEEISVEFVHPTFRHKGVEYKAKDLEKALAAGDEEASRVLNELIKINSGVIRVTKGGKDATG